MQPLVRDLTDKLTHKLDKESESNQFATSVKRVFNIIKKKIGQSDANESYSKLLLELNRRKIKRKSLKAMQVSFFVCLFMNYFFNLIKFNFLI